MGLGPNSSNRSRKPEIRYLVGELCTLLLEKDVFRLDVPVYEIFLVNAFETFHDFNDNFYGLAQREDLAWKFSLISEKISLLAVLHNDDYKIVGWVREMYL
jgi:hypothetical protein